MKFPAAQGCVTVYVANTPGNASFNAFQLPNINVKADCENICTNYKACVSYQIDANSLCWIQNTTNLQFFGRSGVTEYFKTTNCSGEASSTTTTTTSTTVTTTTTVPTTTTVTTTTVITTTVTTATVTTTTVPTTTSAPGSPFVERLQKFISQNAY